MRKPHSNTSIKFQTWERDFGAVLAERTRAQSLRHYRGPKHRSFPCHSDLAKFPRHTMRYPALILRLENGMAYIHAMTLIARLRCVKRNV